MTEVTAVAGRSDDDGGMQSIDPPRTPPDARPIPAIDLARCDLCGACVEGCPSGAAAIVADGLGGRTVRIDAATCNYCTDCEALCPCGAIGCAFEIVAAWHTGATDGRAK